LRNDGLDSELI